MEKHASRSIAKTTLERSDDGQKVKRCRIKTSKKVGGVFLTIINKQIAYLLLLYLLANTAIASFTLALT